jgi:hypothetical protein
MKKDEMRALIDRVFEDKDDYNAKEIPSRFEHAIEKKDFDQAVFFAVLGYLGSSLKGDTKAAFAALRIAADQIISSLNESKSDDKKKQKVLCSFCGKSNFEVKRMISGPNVFICNECVQLCLGVLKIP